MLDLRIFSRFRPRLYTILWNFKSRYRTIYYMFELFKMLSTSDMEEFDCNADSTCFQPGLRSYIESFRHGARTSDCDKNVLKQTSKHSFLPKIQHVEVQREPSVICARSHHMAASVWVWNALCSCLVLRLRWGVCVLGLRTLWKSFKRTKSTRSLTRYSYTPYVSHPKSSCSGDILICYDDSWYYS